MQLTEEISKDWRDEIPIKNKYFVKDKLDIGGSDFQAESVHQV